MTDKSALLAQEHTRWLTAMYRRENMKEGREADAILQGLST